MNKRKASGVIAGKNENQYHIGCRKGDLASDIILVGDPQRALRISKHFDEITIKQAHREYLTLHGKIQRPSYFRHGHWYWSGKYGNCHD
jgi:hypothetical protein